MEFGMPFLLENPGIEDAAQLAAELKLDFVELNMSFPACSLDRMDKGLLNSLQEKYGIYFTFHLHEEMAPCSFSPYVRDAWMREARDAILLARVSRIPNVNVHWPKGVYITLPDHVDYVFARYSEEYRKNALAFRSLCEDASQGEVRVCIENTTAWKPFQTDCIDMLLESPVFGLTLDVGHDIVAGYADEWFYEKHSGRLKHMHLHDAKPTQCHMPLGTGQLDIAALIARAEAANARAVIEIKTIQALRDSVVYLRDIGLFSK